MDHMSYLVKYRHCHPTNFEQISNFESNFERYIQSFFFFVYLCLFCTMEHQEKQHNQMIKLSTISYNNPSVIKIGNLVLLMIFKYFFTE